VSRLRRLIAAFGLLALLAGGSSAQAQDLQCRSPQKSMAVAELLFGRKIDDRIAVTERLWARFVDREITPRFPDGLSVIDAKGQWRDRDRNVIVREPSKLVTIILPGAAADAERLGEIIEAYKKRFKQQSVGLIVRPACVAF
jgi:hypothetical protein